MFILELKLKCVRIFDIFFLFGMIINVLIFFNLKIKIWEILSL